VSNSPSLLGARWATSRAPPNEPSITFWTFGRAPGETAQQLTRCGHDVAYPWPSTGRSYGRTSAESHGRPVAPFGAGDDRRVTGPALSSRRREPALIVAPYVCATR
jgi:hypothetical protein